jgi:putative BNR repeat neuraminidase
VRRRARLGLLLASLGLAFGLTAAAAGGQEQHYGDLGHGSWSWFGDPRAVAVSSPVPHTFVGFIGWNGAITIAEYTPAQPGYYAITPVVAEHVLGYEFHDDHSAPSILVDPSGQLTVFWSAHNGSRMEYRTSTKAGAIDSWGPIQDVPRNIPGGFGFTYPNPFVLSAEQNRAYLFFRGGDWSADYTTQLPGSPWTAPQRLIAVKGQRPYVKYDSNGSNTIAVAFTNGHPANVVSNVYYMDYHGGSLWTAAGARIERLGAGPVRPSAKELVYNAARGHARAWVWDVALSPSGAPVIVYATFPSPAYSKYWYAAWNGHGWVTSFLANAGPTISPGTIETQYSGGITLDHSDPSVVYLSRHVAGGWEIERWDTSDGGRQWHHGVVVPSDGTMNIRPVVPRGSSGGPISLLWLRGHYGTYTSYQTSVYYLR